MRWFGRPIDEAVGGQRPVGRAAREVPLVLEIFLQRGGQVVDPRPRGNHVGRALEVDHQLRHFLLHRLVRRVVLERQHVAESTRVSLSRFRLTGPRLPPDGLKPGIPGPGGNDPPGGVESGVERSARRSEPVRRRTAGRSDEPPGGVKFGGTEPPGGTSRPAGRTTRRSEPGRPIRQAGKNRPAERTARREGAARRREARPPGAAREGGVHLVDADLADGLKAFRQRFVVHFQRDRAAGLVLAERGHADADPDARPGPEA